MWQNVTLASDAPWTDQAQPSHVHTSVVSMAILEISETREHYMYSHIVDRRAALLKGLSKLSGVEVSLQFSCCVRYRLIELNLHGGSRSAMLHHSNTNFLHTCIKPSSSSLQSCDRGRTLQIDYVTSCNFLQRFWLQMLPGPLLLVKGGGAWGQGYTLTYNHARRLPYASWTPSTET